MSELLQRTRSDDCLATLGKDKRPIGSPVLMGIDVESIRILLRDGYVDAEDD